MTDDSRRHERTALAPRDRRKVRRAHDLAEIDAEVRGADGT